MTSNAEELAGLSQATNLPRTPDLLLKPTRILQSRFDWDIWMHSIMLDLKAHGLESIVSSTLPRPTPAEPKFALWRKCAHTVNLWLQTHVSDELTFQLLRSHNPLDYPDVYIKALEKIVTTHDKTLRDAIQAEAMSTKRNDYKSILQFVTAFQEKVRCSHMLSSRILPHEAITTLLTEVKPELPRYANDRMESMTGKAKEKFTKYDFNVVCQEVRDLVRLQEDRLGPARLHSRKSNDQYTHKPKGP
ncbi:hypothetical protein BBP40_010414 [Aspergillus hancockii]|nr:hypothetical protein BBP40_010414 [Aspergillus hancockii]